MTARSDSKVMPLSAAVRSLVRPEMTIHLGVIHGMPYAASYEIARALAGTDPRLTVVTQGAVLNTLTLLHLGLVRRIVTTYCGDVYPTPGPSPILQRALGAGAVTVEDWSMLSLTQRLMAGALGVPFLPSRGPTGTGFAEENGGAYAEVEDPFGGGRQGVVRALEPDLSVYHAWAADPEGNALSTGPHAEGLWGAMAAREGTLLTVERIVSPDEIRAHAELGLLPGRYVRAVCHAPFGCHPGGLSPHGYPGAAGYSEDYDFIVGFQEAAASAAQLDLWIDKWVLGPGDHDGYLRRLGASRLHCLRGRAASDAWRLDLAELLPDGPSTDPAGSLETMTVAAARIVGEIARRAGHDTILAGIGAANLAAWLAHRALRASGHTVELVAEVGFIGYQPRPADPFIFNFANIPTCTARLDVHATLGVLVGGARHRCVAALGAGQVDRVGNINSTKIPNVMHLVGSGGAADVAAGANDVVVVLPLAHARLVDRVPYVTARGERVRAVVTHRGVFEKNDEGELVLTRLLPHPGRSEQEAVEGIQKRCGWPLQIAPQLREVAPPTAEELQLLRSFDPRRSFIGDAGE
jgi:acyl CoA:acetate/3-ketoacid CoA transferase alpha subunit/acyl CoA:acetate/3-ketoacid CoA transferase beta subunit